MKQRRRLISHPLASDLLLGLVLAILLVLLRTLVPQESLKAKAASRTSPAGTAGQDAGGRDAGARVEPGRAAAPPGAPFVTAGDTINGDRITDRLVVDRIERIAATVPMHLLAGSRPASHVRYLAQGFGPGDDAPVFYGVFREPAAALAFGCALDDHLADACVLAPVTSLGSAGEYPPGVQCVPMGLAFGAPAYEPDRCEASS